MADVIAFLSIIPGTFEPGTIMDILPFSMSNHLGGGDLSTFLPVRWKSEKYTLQQLREMIGGHNIYSKKIRMYKGDGGFISTESIDARIIQAVNALESGKAVLGPEELYIFPRFDKIENLDGQLVDAITNPKRKPDVEIPL